MRWIRCIWFLVGLVLSVAIANHLSAQDTSWTLIDEAWYSIEIDGQRAGWANELTFDDGLRYRLTSDQHLTLPRGPDDLVHVSLSTEFIEAHDGEPVSIRQKRKLAVTPEETLWIFHPSSVEEVSMQGGRELRRTLDRPDGPWLMPHAAGAYEEARRAAGAQSIEYRTVDVSSSLRISTVTASKKGEGRLMFLGEEIPVVRWSVVTVSEESGTRESRTTSISEDGELVLAEEMLGAISIATRRTTKAIAQQPIEAGPEIMVRSFVRPSQRIAGSHRATTARYRVTFTGEEGFEFPTAGSQTAEPAAPRGVSLLSVDIGSPSHATGEEQADSDLLAATSLVDCSDEAIVSLARRALRSSGPNPGKRAERLRQTVRRHIVRKDLATAFASASETVRQRSGDCSEHAVLLCALLRSDAIPARVASGLIYADSFAGERDIFGWHMWTQALIDGAWVDLDATTQRPFSAAHILTGVSDLSGGSLSDEFTRTATLMGRLEIEVLDVGYAGQQ